jgi:hypothetical protein
MNAEKKGLGCFAIGCITCVVIALVLTIGAGVTTYLVYAKIKSYTAAAFVPVPVEEGTPERYAEINQRMEDVRQALLNNQAVKAEFTAQDLNICIAQNPELKDVKGKVYLKFDNGLAHAQASVPLNGIPGFSGRYLNGTVQTSLGIENGKISIVPQAIQVAGKNIPNEMMAEFKKSFQQGFENKMDEDPKTKAMLDRIRTLKIEGDKVVIETQSSDTPLPSQDNADPSAN